MIKKPYRPLFRASVSLVDSSSVDPICDDGLSCKSDLVCPECICNAAIMRHRLRRNDLIEKAPSLVAGSPEVSSIVGQASLLYLCTGFDGISLLGKAPSLLAPSLLVLLRLLL
jgi:hypothetical protein